MLRWLAVEREPVPFAELAADLEPATPSGAALEAVEALRRRSLLEHGGRGATFTLQPVVLEYVTQHLVEATGRELVAGEPAVLAAQALLKATGKDYVRRSQERMILGAAAGAVRRGRGNGGRRGAAAAAPAGALAGPPGGGAGVRPGQRRQPAPPAAGAPARGGSVAAAPPARLPPGGGDAGRHAVRRPRVRDGVRRDLRPGERHRGQRRRGARRRRHARRRAARVARGGSRAAALRARPPRPGAGHGALHRRTDAGEWQPRRRGPALGRGRAGRPATVRHARGPHRRGLGRSPGGGRAAPGQRRARRHGAPVGDRARPARDRRGRGAGLWQRASPCPGPPAW